MIPEIRNKVASLASLWTSAKAAFLDAAITSRAAASTALSSAVWTNAKAAFLDAPISGAGGSPPVTSGLKGIATTGANVDPDTLNTVAESTASATTFDVWVEVLGEASASGVLEFMMVYQKANTNSLNGQARLSIDGNVVWTSSTTLWSSSSLNSYGAVPVGIAHRVGTALTGITTTQVRFNSSFSLEVKKTENAAGQIDVGAKARYYLTG